VFVRNRFDRKSSGMPVEQFCKKSSAKTNSALSRENGEGREGSQIVLNSSDKKMYQTMTNVHNTSMGTAPRLKDLGSPIDPSP